MTTSQRASISVCVILIFIPSGTTPFHGRDIQGKRRKFAI